MMVRTIIVAVAIFLLASPVHGALKLNDTAPAFSLRDSEGKDFYLSDVVGATRKGNSNGVILSFFASWCVPCRRELPLLNSLTDELTINGIKVVIAGFKEDFDQIEELLKELKVTKPIILSDRYGKVGEKYGVRFLPTTFFIGGDGKLKDIIFGEIKNEAELRAGMVKLLR